MSEPDTTPATDVLSPEDLPNIIVLNKPPSDYEPIDALGSTEDGIYRHWHVSEIIASFLSFDAASR